MITLHYITYSKQQTGLKIHKLMYFTIMFGCSLCTSNEQKLQKNMTHHVVYSTVHCKMVLVHLRNLFKASLADINLRINRLRLNFYQCVTISKYLPLSSILIIPLFTVITNGSGTNAVFFYLCHL